MKKDSTIGLKMCEILGFGAIFAFIGYLMFFSFLGLRTEVMEHPSIVGLGCILAVFILFLPAIFFMIRTAAYTPSPRRILRKGYFAWYTIAVIGGAVLNFIV